MSFSKGQHLGVKKAKHYLQLVKNSHCTKVKRALTLKPLVPRTTTLIVVSVLKQSVYVQTFHFCMQTRDCIHTICLLLFSLNMCWRLYCGNNSSLFFFQIGGMLYCVYTPFAKFSIELLVLLICQNSLYIEEFSPQLVKRLIYMKSMKSELQSSLIAQTLTRP